MDLIFIFLYLLLNSISGLCNDISQYKLPLYFDRMYDGIALENYNNKLYEFERSFVNIVNQHSYNQINLTGYLYTNVYNINMSDFYKKLSNSVAYSMQSSITNGLLGKNYLFNNNSMFYSRDNFVFNLKYINTSLDFNNELLKDNKVLATAKYIFHDIYMNNFSVNFNNSIFAGYVSNDVKFKELSRNYIFNQDYIYFGLMNNISFYEKLLLNSFINLGKTWNISNNKDFDNKFLGLVFNIEYIINFINYLNIKPTIIASYTKIFDNAINYLNFIPKLEITYSVNDKLNFLFVVSYYNINIVSKNIDTYIDMNSNIMDKMNFIENSHLEYKFGIIRKLFNNLSISFSFEINKELKDNVSMDFNLLYSFY